MGSAEISTEEGSDNFRLPESPATKEISKIKVSEVEQVIEKRKTAHVIALLFSALFNVWIAFEFSENCIKYGTATFSLLFCVSFIFCSLAETFVQWSLGQFSSGNVDFVFTRISGISAGIGGCMSAILSLQICSSVSKISRLILFTWEILSDGEDRLNRRCGGEKSSEFCFQKRVFEGKDDVSPSIHHFFSVIPQLAETSLMELQRETVTKMDFRALVASAVFLPIIFAILHVRQSSASKLVTCGIVGAVFHIGALVGIVILAIGHLPSSVQYANISWTFSFESVADAISLSICSMSLGNGIFYSVGSAFPFEKGYAKHVFCVSLSSLVFHLIFGLSLTGLALNLSESMSISESSRFPIDRIPFLVTSAPFQSVSDFKMLIILIGTVWSFSLIGSTFALLVFHQLRLQKNGNRYISDGFLILAALGISYGGWNAAETVDFFVQYSSLFIVFLELSIVSFVYGTRRLIVNVHSMCSFPIWSFRILYVSLKVEITVLLIGSVCSVMKWLSGGETLSDRLIRHLNPIQYTLGILFMCVFTSTSLFWIIRGHSPFESDAEWRPKRDDHNLLNCGKERVAGLRLYHI